MGPTTSLPTPATEETKWSKTVKCPMLLALKTTVFFNHHNTVIKQLIR